MVEKLKPIYDVCCTRAAKCESNCKHKKPHRPIIYPEPCTKWGPCTESECNVRCVRVKKESTDGEEGAIQCTNVMRCTQS